MAEITDKLMYSKLMASVGDLNTAQVLRDIEEHFRDSEAMEWVLGNCRPNTAVTVGQSARGNKGRTYHILAVVDDAQIMCKWWSDLIQRWFYEMIPLEDFAAYYEAGDLRFSKREINGAAKIETHPKWVVDSRIDGAQSTVILRVTKIDTGETIVEQLATK